VLNYPSRVSLYSVGRQVRVDLEGVAEATASLAGGPRMAWRVGVNDTQQLAAALAFEQMDMALCRFGRTHRGVAGGRCDVEHQVSDVGIAARQDSKLRSSCDGFTDQGGKPVTRGNA
jgi:hypothetical protein